MRAKTTCAFTMFALLLAVSSAAGIFNVAKVNAEPTITITFHKDFGYSSFGNDAQGNWTVQATVSQDTVRVEFYLDNQLQLNDTEAPFAWSYNTDNYPLGLHTFKAVAYDANGNEAVAEAQQNFVKFPMDFFIIIIAVVVVSVLVAVIVAVIKIKKTNKKDTIPRF